MTIVSSGVRANAVSPPGAGHVREVLGTRQVWKTRASQTGGTLACVELTVPPGAGVPPHRHAHEDETFYVLVGRVAFAGDDCGNGVVLDAGGVFYGPRGRLHAFHCEGDETARLLVVITPGGPADALFGELEDLSVRQSRAADAAQVVEACSRYGIVFADA